MRNENEEIRGIQGLSIIARRFRPVHNGNSDSSGTKGGEFMNKQAKTYLIAGMVTGMTLSAGLLLLDSERRLGLKEKGDALLLKLKLKKYDDFPLEEAAGYDSDDTENVDMVSEGSQFGVNYYNKVRD